MFPKRVSTWHLPRSCRLALIICCFNHGIRKCLVTTSPCIFYFWRPVPAHALFQSPYECAADGPVMLWLCTIGNMPYCELLYIFCEFIQPIQPPDNRT